MARWGRLQPVTGIVPRFYESIDTVILGYATYRQIVTELFPDGWIYQGKTSYVLTHRRERPAGDVIFTDEEIAGLITRLKAAEGRDIWICGGADIVNQLIDRRLIDRYHLTIIPTILGAVCVCSARATRNSGCGWFPPRRTMA